MWEVGVYEPSDEFRRVSAHTAVMRADDCRLVAVTGPVGDAASEADARLMAAAPDMLAVLKELAEETEGSSEVGYHLGLYEADSIGARILAAIAKARGQS